MTTTTCEIDEEVEEKTEFKFSELSARAKERACTKYAEHMGNYEWWDCEHDMFHDELEALGFSNIVSCFSGFWSQGDGASFSASFEFSGDKALEFLSKDDKAKIIRYQAEARLSGFNWPEFYLSGSIENSGHYCHQYQMCLDRYEARFDPTGNDGADTLLEGLAYDLSPLWPELRDYARDLAGDYYKRLEKEYEYQTSEEQVEEASEANDWLYDEDGNLL
jgi:hypothetical protein